MTVFKQIHLPQGEQPGLPRTENCFPSQGNPLPELTGQDFRENAHKGQSKLAKGAREISELFPVQTRTRHVGTPPKGITPIPATAT